MAAVVKYFRLISILITLSNNNLFIYRAKQQIKQAVSLI